MNKAVARLSKLLSLPDAVVPQAVDNAASSDVSLPPDYAEFLAHFGPGHVEEFLGLLSPWHENKYLNSVNSTEAFRDALHTLIDSGVEELPPQLPGIDFLNAWGVTENGDTCFWVDPEEGKDTYLVAINEARADEWFIQESTICDVLADWLEGKIIIPVFPPELPFGTHSFEPW